MINWQFQPVSPKTGDARGLYVAAQFQGLNQKRFDYLKKAAENGNCYALVMIALYHSKPNDFCPKNQALFVEYAQKSVDVSCSKGLHELAFCYLTGNGVEKDTERARGMFTQGALLGWLDSADVLGKMCYDGNGGPKDLAEAIIWLGMCFSSNPGSFVHIFDDVRSKFGQREFDVPLISKEMYATGKSLYWYVLDTTSWKNNAKGPQKRFAEKCLKFFCDNIDQHKKMGITFLLASQETLPQEVRTRIAKLIWNNRSAEVNILDFDAKESAAMKASAVASSPRAEHEVNVSSNNHRNEKKNCVIC